MTDQLLKDLAVIETDLDGALYRLSGDEAMYILLLEAFSKDTTMADLDKAIANQSWDDAFTAAHALKGLAGNMGFTPLFHCLGELVILIRTGRIDEIGASYASVKHSYDDIMTVISNFKASGGLNL